MVKLSKIEKKNTIGGFWGILLAVIAAVNVSIGLITGIANIVNTTKQNKKAEKLRSQPKQIESEYIVGNVKSNMKLY